MIYDAKIEIDKQRAIERFEYVIERKKRFELRVIHPKKTIKTNNYLHLILSWFALEYGETEEYVKQEIFKKIVNAKIFLTEHINRKTGEVRPKWRSVADLDQVEANRAINRFRTYASKEAGIYLPDKKDMEQLAHIEKEINNNQEFL